MGGMGMMFGGMGGMGGGFMMGGTQAEEQVRDSRDFTPQEEELGYAMPIKLKIRGSNKNVFTFIYELMRDKPMIELHRLILRNPSELNPADQNIEAETTFIFVPKLFDTIDTVRAILKEIEEEVPQETEQQTAQAEAGP